VYRALMAQWPGNLGPLVEGELEVHVRHWAKQNRWWQRAADRDAKQAAQHLKR
jgi:hypothetical protein